MIPYGRQDIRQADVDAVVEALTSDFLTQGPRVPAFEKVLATRADAAHAVAVNSATSALHIACMALGLGPGDLLWTTPVTFVASANCGIYCGADVDFVDIDPQTYNMSPQALEAKLIAAQAAGRLPKVLVPVHLAGQPCDMPAIHALARRYGVRVIEDASHAIGATLGAGPDKRPVGDCRYSDITVFSFHPVKIVTTAEGGAATTNDADLDRAMRLAASHGVTRDPDLMTHAPDGGWYYQQVALGYNYRMTELQAALGISQMDRLEDYVAARAARAAAYDVALEGLPLRRPHQAPGRSSAWHLYLVQLDLDRPGADQARIFDALRAEGIGVNLHYIPVHLQPFYRARGHEPGDFPVAEAYYARALSIPLFATMTDADQDRVCAALRKVLA
ncbi:UDP-4-amino-4,6-dideoxy-N-acetyl-beta-L-altrosamine transaminase (plasmid) [Brevirhabdus pacifica]|uniref:UDP-4-amino-4, 6-dideoxy-N-acetyl-beta-L-altrosamine transaminase n=1 Tax=Brevirhabdus pacifica TaxID=1267768 RepID=A0A1P8QYB4_9RHOB|nr:UDP-4-amino-4,6-dideoxy-N-acetyl-beta-L-altrosamine transaminase [Brevirhabdus pacifica]APX91393.1 UDP-4-amino-4,6-dideoxy-N-acetyl-beta-L-altrosamine transaminase [Brevirhabdus pacifica]OWU74206.1 spore coat protein [Loktanella sp. 22II-4b]PJJ78989.1 UDP-4-amino-4,6-dideoxy-N-acetyl-beta-L-altrosamine transaminase [Brevirhabdus pacifica]